MISRRRLVTVVEVVAALLGVAAVAIYLVSLRHTFFFPYALDWMEGGTLDVIARVRDGLPVYVAPSAEYVPYRYTPLFFWVGAAMTRLVGIEFVAPRLVSLLSLLGLLALMHSTIRREGGSRLLAWSSVAIYIGTYDRSIGFFHQARIDSLFLFLAVSAFYALRFVHGVRGIVAAAVLLWLSFLTKQSALFVAAAGLPLAALGAPRRGVSTGALFVALLLGTNLVMDHASHGWWGYFVYRLPTLHPLYPSMIYGFWRYDVARVMPVALVGAIAFLAAAWQMDRAKAALYAGLFAGLLMCSWGSRAISGSANVLMPTYAAMAIALPLALIGRDRLLAAGALATQLAILVHVAVQYHVPPPTLADRESGDRLVQFLQSVDGDVLMMDRRFIARRAGRRSWGLEAAAEDIFESSDAVMRNALMDDIIDTCRRGRVAGAIDPPAWLIAAVPFDPPVELRGILDGGMVPKFSLYYPLKHIR